MFQLLMVIIILVFSVVHLGLKHVSKAKTLTQGMFCEAVNFHPYPFYPAFLFTVADYFKSFWFILPLLLFERRKEQVYINTCITPSHTILIKSILWNSNLAM